MKYDIPPARLFVSQIFLLLCKCTASVRFIVQNDSTYKTHMKQIWTFFDLLSHARSLFSNKGSRKVFQSGTDAKIENSNWNGNSQDLEVKATRKGGHKIKQKI